jgi:hypothetical protein
MNSTSYWRKALPEYLKIAFSYFVIVLAPPLALLLLRTLWTGLTKHRWAINPASVGLALIFGGFFFLLALVTAVGDDIQRNWKAAERTVAWNPQVMWRTFIYLGAVFFFVVAFLAYRQGVWLSVFFVIASIGSAITAKRCF